MLGYTLAITGMFHAGDPISYADLTSPYWQQHLVGAEPDQTMRKEDLMMKFRKNQNKRKTKMQRKETSCLL